MKQHDGFIKNSDVNVLLAGGGHKPLSDFLFPSGTSSQFLKADGSIDSNIYNPTNNFKTINGNSIIGTGNISISGASGNYLPLLGFASASITDPGWGTVNSAHGYTNVYYLLTSDSCALAIGKKAGGPDNQLSIQIDGYFYQYEGQRRVLDVTDSPFLGSSYYYSKSGWAWNPFGANQTWLDGYAMRRSDWSGDTGDMRFYLSTSPPGCGGIGICMNIDGYIACLSLIYAGNGFVNGSDISLKKNIKSISSYLPLVEFDWKSDGKHTYGFIAQELVALGYSELVGGIDGRMYVNYDAALAMCLAKLSNIVEQLNMNTNDRIAKLEKRIFDLENLINNN